MLIKLYNTNMYIYIYVYIFHGPKYIIQPKKIYMAQNIYNIAHENIHGPIYIYIYSPKIIHTNIQPKKYYYKPKVLRAQEAFEIRPGSNDVEEGELAGRNPSLPPTRTSGRPPHIDNSKAGIFPLRRGNHFQCISIFGRHLPRDINSQTWAIGDKAQTEES